MHRMQRLRVCGGSVLRLVAGACGVPARTLARSRIGAPVRGSGPHLRDHGLAGRRLSVPSAATSPVARRLLVPGAGGAQERDHGQYAAMTLARLREPELEEDLLDVGLNGALCH